MAFNTIIKSWNSDETRSGYELHVGYTGSWAQLTLYRQTLVRGDRNGEVPPMQSRFVVSELGLHFPMSFTEIERVTRAWCAAFDPELCELLPKLLEGLRAIPREEAKPAAPTTPPAASPPANDTATN